MIPRNARKLARKARENPARARGVAFGIIMVALLLTLVVPFFTTGDVQLSAFSDGDVHASGLRAELVTSASLDVRSLTASPSALAEIENPHATLLIVLGVEKPYTLEESRAILDFVHRGGRLIIADDTGNSKDVIGPLGLFVPGFLLLDESSFLGDPNFLATHATLDGARYDLVFNKPSFITFLGDAARPEVLAASSNVSYETDDPSGEVTRQNRPGPFPLVVRLTHGEGIVVAVSDPGLFQDRQTGLDEFENLDFARALAARLVPAGGLVLVDESRHVQPSLVRVLNAQVRAVARATNEPWLGGTLALALVAATGFAIFRIRRAQDWSQHAFDVGHEKPVPDDVQPSAHRVRLMAQRAIAERFNMSIEYLQAMPREAVAQLTGDPELATVATGEARPAEIQSVLRKISNDGETQERGQ